MNYNCSVYKAADFIGKKWTLNIILEIYKGKVPIRYSKIKTKLPGITAKILSLRLKELERLGIIKHTVDASKTPIKSFYSLTDSGQKFIKVIKDIKSWAVENFVDNEHCKNTQCRHCEF